MEEQKYCIKHKLSNGTYLAVLNNGWRYDGSIVVEADTERELEYKLSQARYDDRWVTLNGSHILIGGTGRIKSGAGGRLKGRMFGMNFSDYENGKKSKKGKKLIRVYKPMKKTGESKKVVTGKGKAKSGAMQITKHEEIQGALQKAGFKHIGAGFMAKTDKQLAIETTNQILALEHKFGVVKSCKVELKTDRSKSTYGSVTITRSNADTQILTLSEVLFGNRAKMIDSRKRDAEPDASGMPFKMPCDEDKLSIYTITHEYGHMLQNMLITQRFKADGWDDENSGKFRDKDGAIEYAKNYGYYSKSVMKRMYEVEYKWYDERRNEVVDQCRKEIIAIAKKNNKRFKISDNISKYGKSSKEEFFAEVFANSQLGKPNELGIAMQQWLVQKGLVINE